jgi:hypothetical protein
MKLYDPVDLVPLHDAASADFLTRLGTAARGLQEEFKRTWLALVGPVTFQAASPAMVELCVKAAAEINKAQWTKPKT